MLSVEYLQNGKRYSSSVFTEINQRIFAKHLKCFKVTAFKYFQKVAINIAPNALFVV